MKLTAAKRFEPAGYCIYCGATEPGVSLTTEHIIPESIGGNRLLPKATCQNCSNETSRFTRICCSSMFQALRVHHDAPTKHPKRPEKRDRLIAGMPKDGPNMLPAENNQGMLIMPVLPPPRVLRGNATGRVYWRPWVRGTHPDFDSDFESTGPMPVDNASEIWGTIHAKAFMRLLAQIARGFTVACWRRPVTDLIGQAVVDPEADLTPLVGSCSLGLPRTIYGNDDPAGQLHEVIPVLHEVAGIHYLTVQIRLFASMFPDVPTYVVVAGTTVASSDFLFLEREQPYAFTAGFRRGGQPWRLEGHPGAYNWISFPLDT